MIDYCKIHKYINPELVSSIKNITIEEAEEELIKLYYDKIVDIYYIVDCPNCNRFIETHKNEDLTTSFSDYCPHCGRYINKTFKSFNKTFVRKD